MWKAKHSISTGLLALTVSLARDMPSQRRRRAPISIATRGTTSFLRR